MFVIITTDKCFFVLVLKQDFLQGKKVLCTTKEVLRKAEQDEKRMESSDRVGHNMFLLFLLSVIDLQII